MSLENINNAVRILDNSPIRKYLEEHKDSITLFDKERELLNKIDDIISVNIENSQNQLKIVVLGEVKAGKSTLINSLIQKKVTYTNVVEATASIIEINYNESDNIFIHYNNDEKLKVNSLEELDKLMDDNRTNQEFFNEIKKIKISTKTDRLRKIAIVDTPGLNTITSENAQRTDDYIKNADVILWVLNIDNLGDSDIIDKIEDIMGYGKPMIGIVNRIDEIDGDEEEILDYVQTEMGYMFDEIFTTSAKKAWDGFIQNNHEKLEESNINNLYEFIINNIENNSKKYQERSVEESIISQLEKDLYIHSDAKDRLSMILNQIDKDSYYLKKINDNIKKIARNKMNDWLNMEFFVKEKKILETCKNNEEYIMLEKKYRNEEYINNLVNTQYNKVASYIESEWKQHSDEFISKKEHNANFSINMDRFENKVIEQDYSTDEILEGAKNGSMTAGAVGLSLAGYAAWLGPAASSVTIVSAVGTFVPPLLIAGAVAGGVSKYIENKEYKNRKYNEVDKVYKEIKDEVRENILTDAVDKLDQCSDYYYKHITDMICGILKQCNTSKEEVEDINMKLIKYIENLEVELMKFK